MSPAFLVNRDESMKGEILQRVHVAEDESVCVDWSTPHSSIFEIFLGEIISHVSAKYRVTYSHDCHKVKTSNAGGGLDWTTIQQAFPASGLVLDYGYVTEDELVGLCKGCMSLFNPQQAVNSQDRHHPNPNWFIPHSTHYCIIYPGTPRPVMNSADQDDLTAGTEYKLKAYNAPIPKVCIV